MPNAQDANLPVHKRLLVVGRTGSGKSTQMWTLPGRKFAYFFDPNALQAVQGLDLDYESFLPDILEMDATIKGFNKNARPDDRPPSDLEPTAYMRWVEDINKKADTGFFQDYQWLCIDSMTFLVQSIMNRQLWINRRYGSIEELGDFRVVGSKISDLFGPITSLPLNLYCTGHIDSYQDEKTKKIETQLRLPGRGRAVLPLMFTDVWQAMRAVDDGKDAFAVRTKPDPRGLLDIRCSIRGLEEIEDVNIDFSKDPTTQGIGALLARNPHA